MSETTQPPTATLGRGERWFKATCRTDLTTGRVEYEISGRAMAGVIVLEPAAEHAERFDPSAYGQVALVSFGRGPVGARETELTDAPVINRVQLRRGSFTVNWAEDTADLAAKVHREGSSECPAATKQAGADVVLALVEHWSHLPERPALVAAYLRRIAPDRIAEQQGPMMTAAVRLMAEGAGAIETCTRVVEAWRDFAEPHRPETPAAAGEAAEDPEFFGDDDEYDELEEEAGYEDEYDEEDPEEAEARRNGEEEEECNEHDQAAAPEPYYDYCPHNGGAPGTCEDCRMVRGHDAMFDEPADDAEAEEAEDEPEKPAAQAARAKGEADRLIEHAVRVEQANPYADVRGRVRRARLAAHDARAGLLRAFTEDELTSALAALIGANRALRRVLSTVPAALSYALGAVHSGDAVHLAWGFAGEAGRGVWCAGEHYEEITLTIAELPGTSKLEDSDVIDALSAHGIELGRLCRQCFGPTTRIRYAARLKVTAKRSAEQLAAVS